MKSYFEGECSINKPQITKLLVSAGFKILRSGIIERSREINCTIQVVMRWHAQFCEILHEYDDCPELVFNMDEIMMQHDQEAKQFVLLPNSSRVLLPEEKKRAHITACCCFNAVGVTAPLQIIFSNIEKLDASYSSIYPSVNFATEHSGYMTKELFYEWAKIFCKFIADYRHKLEPGKMKKPVLLILDSHNSRASIKAIEMFQQCNIKCITLPPHSTHAMQPFDIAIAKSVKNNYSKGYKTLINMWNANRKDQEKTIVSEEDHRKFAVEAFVNAWKTCVNLYTAQNAFAKSGLNPWHPEVTFANSGINYGSPLDPEKSLRMHSDAIHISSTELTNREFSENLKNQKLRKSKPSSGQKKNSGMLTLYGTDDPSDIIYLNLQIQEKIITEDFNKKKAKICLHNK